MLCFILKYLSLNVYGISWIGMPRREDEPTMSFSGTDTVWSDPSSKGTDHRMSKQAFAGLITVFTLGGIVFAMLAGSLSYDWQIKEWNGWALVGFVLAVIVVSLGGTMLYLASNNPAVSLAGYALVAGPFGLLLGPLVALYTPESVAKVAGITIFLVAVLGVIGASIPDSLEKWSTWLFVGLLVLLAGYFVVPVLGVFGVDVAGGMKLLDWAGVVLFGAIVVYDMNRAMRVERTLDKAIDCAGALFSDVINIFIRLLSLFGVARSQ